MRGCEDGQGSQERLRGGRRREVKTEEALPHQGKQKLPAHSDEASVSALKELVKEMRGIKTVLEQPTVQQPVLPRFLSCLSPSRSAV